MRVDSLAFRLFATSAVWTLLVLPLAGFLIYSLYRDDFQTSFDNQLRKLVTAINVDAMLAGGDAPVAPTNRYEPLFEIPNSGWYWQIKPLDNPEARTLVSASLGTATLRSPFERSFPSDETGTRWMNVKGPDGAPIRIVEMLGTLGHEEGAPRYSIIVAGPLEWFDAAVSNFTARLTTALALTGLGLMAVTLFQIRFGLLPLQRIERGLAEIRSGQSEKLEGQLPAEIEPLQTELNALIQSNQDIVDRARTQVGNLAHALKTPLAVIVNEARDGEGTFANKVAGQAEIMRDQINLYLDRARMAARVGVVGRVTLIRPVVDPLVRALERIHRDRGITIEVKCSDYLKFQGEKQDLEEMLGNLLDNACKWAKGKVYLSVETLKPGARTQPPRVIIVIEDDGKGLSSDQRARIGQRGLRLDETKPGTGLGLSIVIDLAQSYRGNVKLDQSEHGGLLARLELPGV